MLDYMQIISSDDNIALFVETDISTTDPNLVVHTPESKFTYRSIKVIPKKLPEDLFDYESLLAEMISLFSQGYPPLHLPSTNPTHAQK